MWLYLDLALYNTKTQASARLRAINIVRQSREKERERGVDRQTDKDKNRERQEQRETESETQREGERESERERERERERAKSVKSAVFAESVTERDVLLFGELFLVLRLSTGSGGCCVMTGIVLVTFCQYW